VKEESSHVGSFLVLSLTRKTAAPKSRLRVD
jgi:hypothetical protein